MLQFVFETLKRIEINLLKEKVAIGFLKCEEKPPKKIKIGKAILPSHLTDTSAVFFKCSKIRHLKKDCKEGKIATP